MPVVRLTQLDGALPNLALMKLAAWHRDRGDEIRFYSGAKGAERHLDEPAYERVYASTIFKFSAPLLEKFKTQFPEAVIGGTGSDSNITVEELIGESYEKYDYSIAPRFTGSLGFTQRGCRLKCSFCVVPHKEGKPAFANTIPGIWRGPGFPKHLHLLDNDFMGQERSDWEARIDEIRTGGFKVCFNQGLNVRLITPEGAKALATIEYRDDGFKRRRIYTAWDNYGKDEIIFMRGVGLLRDAGIPPSHLMAYMLIGFDKKETWERLFYRFEKMVALGIRPYPMVFGEKTAPCSARRQQQADRPQDARRIPAMGQHRALPRHPVRRIRYRQEGFVQQRTDRHVRSRRLRLKLFHGMPIRYSADRR